MPGTKLALMQRIKRPLFALVAIILGLALVEGLLSFAWIATEYVARRLNAPRAVEFKEDFHARHDPDLGWAHLPEKKIVDFYGPGRTITINRQGVRGLVEYDAPPPEDRLRVVCLGDSFTLGYGVDDEATYPAQLEAINPRVQAVNMGQGGYSIGQCYLWFERDGARLQPDVLVAAFIIDDIWRMTGGRLANGAAMPRFELVDSALRVSGQPVPEKIAAGQRLDPNGGVLNMLWEHSAIFRTAALVSPSEPDAAGTTDPREQLRVALAILDALHQEAARLDIPFVLVLLPELVELVDPGRAAVYRDVATAISRHAESAGIPLLDLSPHFLAASDIESLYLDEQWHHLSEAGNRLVAKRLDEFLRENLPDYPPRS